MGRRTGGRERRCMRPNRAGRRPLLSRRLPSLCHRRLPSSEDRQGILRTAAFSFPVMTSSPSLSATCSTSLFFVTRNILRRHSARKGNKTENSGDKAHLSERSTKNHFYQRVVIKLMPCATPASTDTAFLQSSVKPPSVPKPSEKGFPFLLPARSRARIFPFATKGETV